MTDDITGVQSVSAIRRHGSGEWLRPLIPEGPVVSDLVSRVWWALSDRITESEEEIRAWEEAQRQRNEMQEGF